MVCRQVSNGEHKRIQVLTTCVHVYVCLQCTSRIGKGSPRCTIDEIAIYNDLQCIRTWLGSQFSYEAAGLQVS